VYQTPAERFRDQPPIAPHHGAPLPTSLATQAAALMRRMIISGELAPGERIVENRLAPLLGLSRPPLREGLRLLEQEGLVTQEMYRGATVVNLSRQDIYEIVTLRRVLEESAIRIGVPVRAPERLLALEETFATLLRHAADGNEESAADDSYALHLALIKLAGNSRLLTAYQSLSLQLTMALNRRSRADTETLVERAERHRGLVAAVRAGDPDGVLAILHDEAATDYASRLRDDGDLTPEAAEWFAARGTATRIRT